MISYNYHFKEENRMSAKRVLQLCLILVLMLVSMAATSNAYASSACGSSYVVQPGDWLAKIARYCGVYLSDLQAANPWTYYYHYIYPGQVLTIPGGYNDGGYPPPPPPPPPPYNPGYYCGPSSDANGSYYVVCRGDTLGSIARYYGVSWQYLQSINGIYNPNLIYPGQVIRIYY